MGKFGPKIHSCSFRLKIGTHGISRMRILIQAYVFWIPKQKSILGQFFCQNRQICPSSLKTAIYGVSKMLILIPTLVFWKSNHKTHFFCANLGQKNQTCPFCLKICTDGISRIWILIPTLVFWICNPKTHFLGKFGPKKLKLSVLPENWHTWYLKDTNSYSNIVFWISELKSIFRQSYAKEVKLPVLSDVVTQRVSKVLSCVIEICNWRRYQRRFVDKT